MKHILLTIAFAALVCSCGGKTTDNNATASGGDITKRVFLTKATYTPEPGCHYGISAEIKKGKVYVTVNPDEFEKAPFAGGMDYRLNETTYEVQNTDAPIVSIYIGDIGQDYNPVACMLRDDGKVQIASIFDGISRLGFFQASYPLPNLENIVEFRSKNFGDHMGIAAIDGDGTEFEIPYNPAGLSQYIYTTAVGTQLRLTFTPDWKFICQHFIAGDDGGVTEIKEYVGEYTLAYINDEFDNQEIGYTIHTLANVLADDNAPKPYKGKGTFRVQYTGGTAMTIKVTPQTGNLLPLPKGQPATFTRDEQ